MVSKEIRTVPSVTEQLIEVFHNPKLATIVSRRQDATKLYDLTKRALRSMRPDDQEKLAHHVIETITTTPEDANYAFGMLLLQETSSHECDPSLLQDKYVASIVSMRETNITRENIDKLLTVGNILLPHISSKDSTPKEVLTSWDTVLEKKERYMDTTIQEEIDVFKIKLGMKYIENFDSEIAPTLKTAFLLKLQNKTDREIVQELGISEKQYDLTYKEWLKELIKSKRGQKKSPKRLSLQTQLYAMLMSNPKITSQELAEALQVSKPVIDHACTVLREKGLIEKRNKGGKKSSEVLSLQAKVYQMLMSEPNISSTKLAEILNVSKNEIDYARRCLIKEEGMLHSKGGKKKSPEIQLIEVQVHQMFMSDPNISQKELAEALQVSIHVIENACKVLRKKGMIETRNAGRKKLPEVAARRAKVRELRMKFPNMPIKAIAEELGAPVSTIKYDCHILASEGKKMSPEVVYQSTEE